MASDFAENQTEAQEDENLITRLVLRIHAANLPCHGILRSPPSSFAEVTSIGARVSRSGPHYNDDSLISAATMTWGQTEIINKNRHPQWTTTFEIDYEYGSECYFSVNIYRANRKENEDLVSFGAATCEVGDILGSKKHTKVKRLPKGGVVFCRLEAVNTHNESLIARFQFQAFINNNRKSLVSKLKPPPDTIFQISKRHPNSHRHTWLVVYRSSPMNESFEPRWDVAEVDLAALCNGDFDRPLRLRVLLHKKKRGGNICIGECETTLRMILNTQRGELSCNSFGIFKSVESQVTVGQLEVPLAQVIDLKLEEEVMIDNYQINCVEDDVSGLSSHPNPFAIDMSAAPTDASSPPEASFSDYIDHGWLLDFMIAIDFTSSNGDPRIAGTLHDQANESLNDYEECIEGIGCALGRYSESCTIWGFGAKFDGATRHLFQLGKTTTCHGSVDTILQAYRGIFESDLIMSGPTLFDQVIQAAAVRANKSKVAGALRYSVLLILTDGISQDFEETRRKLNVYSSLPLSVIFVGLGRSDFHAMHKLTSQGDSNRTISSFVAYREHQHDPRSLGAAALQSLPHQFVEYMTRNNICQESL